MSLHPGSSQRFTNCNSASPMDRHGFRDRNLQGECAEIQKCPPSIRSSQSGFPRITISFPLADTFPTSSSILEIIQLKFAPGVSPDDPTFLKNMSNVRTALRERVHNTNSRCYQCIEDPSLLFIFGIWPDLATHQAFLSSPLKNEILALQQDQTKFQWMVHINLAEGIEELPFDAPVMNVARLRVKDGHVTAYDDIMEKKHKGLFREATKPYNSIRTWRVDPEAGVDEVVVITGWDSVEAHEEMQKKTWEWTKDALEHIEGYEAFHARNMER